MPNATLNDEGKKHGNDEWTYLPSRQEKPFSTFLVNHVKTWKNYGT